MTSCSYEIGPSKTTYSYIYSFNRTLTAFNGAKQGRIVVFDVYWRRRAGLAEGKGGVVVAPLVLHRTLIVARVPLARLLQQGLS